jgi:hypothetical protein
MNRLRLLCWTLSIVSGLSLSVQVANSAIEGATPTSTTTGTSAPAQAAAAAPAEEASTAPKVTKEQRVEQWGSQSVAVKANQAAQAMQAGKYSAAISNFRSLIGLDRNNEDFYLGLYSASSKSENWGQAVMALEELFDRKPELKGTYAKDFAEALKKAGREASEIKAAEKLIKKSNDNLLATKVQQLVDKSLYEEIYIEPKKPEPVKRVELDPSKVHIHSSRLGLNYETAFAQCENIVIADYVGNEYDKNRPPTYFTPPKAKYHIVEYLKGAPFNKAIALKYEFHDEIISEEKPADWKFHESLFPKKGSRWILFIPNAVPIDGMLHTYHGRYGRQEYTEENYDKILKVIQEHRGQT